MLQPPTHEFLHRTVQSRQMHEQFLKSLSRYSNRIERCGSADCRIAWLVRNERSFTENVAGMELREQGTVALDIRLAFDDKVNLVAKITVREDRFSRLKMLAVDGLFVKQPKLRDIAWQEDVENPVRHQAKLTVESWKLRDVNTTPQQPGDESFESKAENFRDRRASAE